MKLRAVLAKYLQDADLADASQKYYLHSVNRWEKNGPNPSIDDITVETLIAFREGCDHLSPASFNSSWYAVRVLLNYSKSRGWIETVPAIKPMRQRRGNKPQMPAVDELGKAYGSVEFAKWPRSFPAHTTVSFWRLWFVVAYFTAFRRRDLFRVAWSDIDFDANEITLVAHKTGKTHIIPIHDVLRRHLLIAKERESRVNTPDDRLFPVNSAMLQFRNNLKRICEFAGVNSITPQQIRRASSTQYERAKGGAGSLILGHSLRVSELYISAPEVLIDASEKLAYPNAFTTIPERQQLSLF